MREAACCCWRPVPFGHPWSRIPIGYARLLTNPAANWLYSSEPETNTNGRRVPVPRGRLLGGSSAITAWPSYAGQAQDFDSWAQMATAAELQRCAAFLQSAWKLRRRR